MVNHESLRTSVEFFVTSLSKKLKTHLSEDYSTCISMQLLLAYIPKEAIK